MRITPFLTGLICFTIIGLSQPLLCLAQTKNANGKISSERKYKPSDRYRYRLTTYVEHNGEWNSTIIAVCELQVVTDSTGIPYDEVRWLSKKVMSPKDTTDETAEALKVKPYHISLHEKGRLDIPQIDIASMTGEITDFNTFFVAVSPKLGINELKKPGDVYVKKETTIGDFANGKDILKGNDCLAIQVKLTGSNKENVIFETSFLPPADSCLHFLTTDMKVPVAADTLNNFQMVRPTGNNRFNVLYGKEDFVINSTLQKKDGKIKQASMVNRLSLKIKVFCDDQYANCQTTMPFTILRNLKLELMP